MSGRGVARCFALCASVWAVFACNRPTPAPADAGATAPVALAGRSASTSVAIAAGDAEAPEADASAVTRAAADAAAPRPANACELTQPEEARLQHCADGPLSIGVGYFSAFTMRVEMTSPGHARFLIVYRMGWASSRPGDCFDVLSHELGSRLPCTWLIHGPSQPRVTVVHPRAAAQN
jgi:hypothetical protein